MVNFDDLFRRSNQTPLIINDVVETTEADRENTRRFIYTEHEGDVLSNLPSCECGVTKGRRKRNQICPVCKFPVVFKIEQTLEPFVWIRAPKNSALMNPNVWIMLRERFTISGFEIIRWICQRDYKVQNKTPAVVEILKQMGIQRGYNYFVQNFDKIMETLFSLKAFKPKRGMRDDLRPLLEMYRDCIFSQYLPLPNRSVLVIESNSMGRWGETTTRDAVNAIMTMKGVDAPNSTFSDMVRENRAVKALVGLADFYDNQYKNTLAKKEGVFRKQVFSTRAHFVFRGVITSLTDVHDYEELHTPWGMTLSLLTVHLKNRLLRMGFTPNDADAYLNAHAHRYSELLDNIMAKLIEESPYKGIPVIFQRNPSLERGSAQSMFITKVKKDPNIQTISLSILTVSGFNADFDGDQLNGTLLLDNYTAEELYPLAPHMSTFDLNEPRKVSGNLSWPKPVVATVANLVHADHSVVDPVKLRRMAEIPTL